MLNIFIVKVDAGAVSIVRQPFLIAKIADPLRVGELVLLVPAHDRIEVGADLEHFMKLIVPSVEQVI